MNINVYFLFFFASILLFGCSDDVETSADTETGQYNGNDSDTDTGQNGTDSNIGSDTASDTTSDWNSATCVVTSCAGTVWQCGDCLENDSDGKIDSLDPDCLGPCDNNESGFIVDIPGSAPGNCDMDCYFDNNNGGGNDGCLWDFRCDENEQHYKESNLSAVCAYEPENVSSPDCDGMRVLQAEQCNSFCEPLVPNGCDCWGCCAIAHSSPNPYRFVGTPGCSLTTLENCDPCTPVPACENTCGECELCIGMTELPANCLTDKNRCSQGVTACGQKGDLPCPGGTYCITGCCVESTIFVAE